MTKHDKALHLTHARALRRTELTLRSLNTGLLRAAFSRSYVPQVKTTDLGLGGSAAFSSWGSGGAGFYGNGANERCHELRRVTAAHSPGS